MSVFDDLKSAVIEYDQNKATASAQTIVDEDLDPLTGLPLGVFLMGSPGHTLGPPLP